MYPNANFLKYFPHVQLPEVKGHAFRSGCLRIGAYLVIRKLIAAYRLDEILEQLLGKESGLFLDLAAYTIVTEGNAGQYYPDYAFNHPLLTSDMRVYSDSKVSDFLHKISRDQAIGFQNAWNATHDHREKIYISYDSTNKNCQAGDLDLAEFGHPKDNQGKPILNIAIGYDRKNSEPLFYEEYPGSIVDIVQLQRMLEKAQGYGYQHIGFILDRGYFSQSNIHYMDQCGYDFVIMMKGMKPLVKELVDDVKGRFEDKREYSIRDYNVSGITVKRQLYPSDKHERYFHIYYSDRKKSAERDAVEYKIDHLAQFLKENEGGQLQHDSGIEKYFDLIYYHEGKADETFMYGRERYDVIDEEIKLCGYFLIITSEEMTAAEALDLYKGRDASEKLFRGDKSYLGNRSYRIQSNESMHAKIFVEFVALILRNKMHFLLKEQMKRNVKRANYMNVPAAIRELEKIEMVRLTDHVYRLDHAVTATQKEILKAFAISEPNVRAAATEISQTLSDLEHKEETK
jgi:transposase